MQCACDLSGAYESYIFRVHWKNYGHLLRWHRNLFWHPWWSCQICQTNYWHTGAWKALSEQKQTSFLKERIENIPQKVKEIINNLQTAFREEYDLLGSEEQSEENNLEIVIWGERSPSPKREKPYKRENLEPYLKETKYEKFKEFVEKWGDSIEEDWDFYQIINYLEEWEELSEGKEIIENPYEIYVHEREQGIIVFSWKKPDRNFQNLSNHLFYFYGEWMMVANWEQINYEIVKITAASSIFYNRYWYFLKSSANGILKHSPLAKIEACHCLSSPNISSFRDFIIEDYRPLKLVTVLKQGDKWLYCSTDSL